jgi:hypothetical protein
MKEDEMDGACSTRVGYEKCVQNFSRIIWKKRKVGGHIVNIGLANTEVYQSVVMDPTGLG